MPCSSVAGLSTDYSSTSGQCGIWDEFILIPSTPPPSCPRAKGSRGPVGGQNIGILVDPLAKNHDLAVTQHPFDMTGRDQIDWMQVHFRGWNITSNAKSSPVSEDWRDGTVGWAIFLQAVNHRHPIGSPKSWISSDP